LTERSKRTRERKTWGAKNISGKTQDVNKRSGSEKGRMLFKSTDIFLLKKVGYNFAVYINLKGKDIKIRIRFYKFEVPDQYEKVLAPKQ
jgi:hypothetical protein